MASHASRVMVMPPVEEGAVDDLDSTPKTAGIVAIVALRICSLFSSL